MAKSKIKICLYCGLGFEVATWRITQAKYCSFDCFNKARTTKHNTKKPRKCVGCGKEYIPTTWNQKWCSRECFCKHSQTGKSSYPHKCPVCEKEYQSIRKTQKYCSRKCAAKDKKGKVPKQTKPVKTNILDTLWAKLIKELADNKCEYCGKTNRLNSHHIFSRSNYNTRWEKNNGVCLCVYHHVLGTLSAHKSPIEFVEWLKEKRGIIWYENLRCLAALPPQKHNKEKIKEQLKQELDSLQPPN